MTKEKCSECDWETPKRYNNQCLNPDCSKRNIEQCERVEFYNKNNRWPEDLPLNSGDGDW